MMYTMKGVDFSLENFIVIDGWMDRIKNINNYGCAR